MDNVDIGGAAAHGRPAMPAMTVIDVASGDLNGTMYPGNVLTAKKPPVPTVNSLFGPAAAMYAADHPANAEGVEQVDGAIKLTRSSETRRIDLYKPLGDIREGYVTGPRVDGQAKPAEDTEVVLATLKRELAAAEQSADAGRDTAHDDEGAPLIEVLYHLDIGVLASYYSQVVEQDRWLVFVDDTKRPAAQKFIPKPLPEGSEPLKITITGSDRVESHRRIVPLGINFSLGRYDIFVTMLAPDGESE